MKLARDYNGTWYPADLIMEVTVVELKFGKNAGKFWPVVILDRDNKYGGYERRPVGPFCQSKTTAQEFADEAARKINKESDELQ